MADQPRRPQSQRRWASAAFLFLAAFAVAARYILFSKGILYGEAAAKMASLMVAGIIIAAGYLPLRMLRPSEEAGEVPKETIAATVAAVLGLATTGYAISELLAPNTPVAATAPACNGVPVYGAPFFAKTEANGVNARRGPGREYQQANRYEGNCTLGFDGYCIGRPEPDFVLHTPDQRWLLVHDRNQLVASAVVLSQSPESALGTAPSPKCAKLGGLPQPSQIVQFSYIMSNGQLEALAPGAAAVGYGLATVPQRDRTYQPIALAVDANFSAKLAPGNIANLVQTSGGVWLAASVCLADNVPVVNSLRAIRLTFRGTHIVGEQNNASPPSAIRSQLAEIACNSSG